MVCRESSLAWVEKLLGACSKTGVLLVAALSLSMAGASRVQAAPEPAFKVCADPDNMPFSAEKGAQRGLYIELAELVGQKLALPVQYTWWYTHMQRRAMRGSILQGDCDVMFALPASTDYRHRGIVKSRPILDVAYAMVYAKGALPAEALAGGDAGKQALQTALKGKRLALQFSSTPHVVFATVGGYQSTTHKDVDEVFDMLAKGQADVGFVWGPVAGWENKTKHQGRWQVTPVSGHEFSGQVVAGVRSGLDELKVKVDQALTDLQPQIQELARKYGFPTDKPLAVQVRSAPALAMPMAQSPAWAGASGAVTVSGHWLHAVADAPSAASAAKKRPAKAPARKASGASTGTKVAAGAAGAAAAAAAAPALDPLAQAGRVKFNDACSHCHGSDGATPIRERDVRRLSMRYDAAKWQEVANTTIRNGRPDAGMPPWKDTLSEQQIKEVLAFLGTIQK